ncbi:homoserine dehydrogenase [Candidatus Marimicrobium litorale]|uniref:Homoserine dehydrogenase n=1 Tax=Candidatus Marimicrobium litorale TaxID=2518991 RepID=A0ABT3T153_9GAMM|nr:homoserine dehydrogenase [Candidatus Marimicrobium litorale]MCX2975988.1 homoserine dehydrogenase [Candidatus Marimicrobium litorale]
MSPPLKIGICGLGTVGSGTFNLLHENADLLKARAGVSLDVVHVGARRDNPACDLSGAQVSRDIFAVAADPEVAVVVELIGGTTVARELVEAAIRAGKHVVTANKALIAEHGNALFALAVEHSVQLRYEAAIAGGIPIVKALREGLSGNRIEWLAGIINGTTNFILTEMRDKGRDFADVLAEAQALGYAEADPTFDVEGVDAAHKLVILASLAFGMPLKFESVYTEGITRLQPQDVAYAEELGYVIKHLGIARQTNQGVELRVHPTLIPRQRLLANVDGVRNAVLIEGNAVGPTLYCGAGAGDRPTASAVLADLVDLGRATGSADPSQLPALGVASGNLQDLPVLAMEDVESPWYLRMEARDKPGVMSGLTSLFSEQGISIEALIQKAPLEGQTLVSVIVVTNQARQGSVKDAVRAIEGLDSIDGDVTCIRVEQLDG